MNRNIISGEKSAFQKYNRGYGEYFFEQAHKFRDRIFQIDGRTGRKETYASVLLRSTRAAISLRQLGVTRDDVLMSCASNTTDTVVPHLSTLYLGAVISAMAPTQTAREWAHCLNAVNPKLVFVEEDLVEKMIETVGKLETKPRLVVVGESAEFTTLAALEEPSRGEESFRPVAVTDCHDTAFVLYSSGTTGLSKGICISHFKMINEAKNALSFVQDASVTLNYASLFWISAVLILTITIEYGGTRLILHDFDAEDLMNMVQKYKVTFFFSPPLYAHELTNLQHPEKYDVASLKLYLIGGSRISPEQLARTRKLFEKSNVSFGYGATEVACFSTCFDFSRDKHLLHRLESVGKPINDVEIKVVDPETKKLLGPNQQGEICIKTVYSMNGYHRIDSSPYYDDQGFFKTGDIGYYDRNDCLYIVDRIKEMFKYQNLHVVPSMLESILLEHPRVKEAGVFGIPDDRDGFHPAACIVLENGPGEEFDARAVTADIQKFYNEHVSDSQQLRGGLKIVDCLPRTASSKLQRTKLLELFIMN